MPEVIVKTAIAYLLGSLMGALLVGRVFGGVDIRRMGSGNAGGTNALRTQGLTFAILVVVIDLGKGVVASAWLPGLTLPGLAPSEMSISWLAILCGGAAVIGHVFPIYYGFAGGKGVATLVGAVLGLSIKLALIALAVFVACLVLTGYVGLSSIVATVGFAGFAAWSFGLDSPLFIFGAVMSLFVVFTHRSNIARMLAGTEDRKRGVMLFHRLSR